jgi:hypothetical protein
MPARFLKSDLPGGTTLTDSTPPAGPTAVPKPTTGRILRYRGKQGLCAMRAAIVTADVTTLDPRGVESGEVPALTDDMHVHLWVFTPGALGGFPEYDVPFGAVVPGDIPPGTWSWPPRS